MHSSQPHATDEPRRYAVLGQRVAVSAADAPGPWLDRLDGLLAGFRESGPVGELVARFRVRPGRDGALWQIKDGGSSTPAWTDNALLRELERRAFEVAIRQSALPLLLLHAGAVARDGVALLLPAVSESGKTTLTLALARRGWLPLTDDICPLEREGDRWFALLCPRCCHLSVNTVETLLDYGIALEGPVGDLAGYYRPLRWGERTQVCAIAVPHFAADAASQRTRLSQAECLVEMISATFEQAAHPRAEQRLAARHLATQAPGFRLTYSSVEDALCLVEELVDELAQGTPPHAARQVSEAAGYPA